MALVGNMIATSFGGNPSVVNYDMFVAVFSFLCLFYLIFVAIRDSFVLHEHLPLLLDALNVLFFFCAAVAMAAELGAHSCSNTSYLDSNHITNGSKNDKGKRCREAQAVTAFLWFAFASYVASLVFSLFGSGSGRVNLRGGGGGIRKGGPSMSQV